MFWKFVLIGFLTFVLQGLFLQRFSKRFLQVCVNFFGWVVDKYFSIFSHFFKKRWFQMFFWKVLQVFLKVFFFPKCFFTLF